jgi:ubiquinone/menaquinone biosynthesis C-methylase UbiE
MADFDLADPAIVAVYDDLPLWSAACGQLLLEEIRLAPGLRALDVGCGSTGFPLVELAERLGPAGEAHGVDPWAAGLARARQKIARRGVPNAFVHEGNAEALPFPDGHFDLIVSSLGLNNFERPAAALRECRRVAREGAEIALASNLQGTFAELYEELPAALAAVGVADAGERVAVHVAHRTTVPRTQDLLAGAGFEPVQAVERSFRMRYADGAAVLAHHFIRLGFRPAWEELAPEGSRAAAMEALRQRLDERAARAGEVVLTVPIACVLGRAR